ncbi:unnamed protein product [Peronospora belbahrii]|uniref:Uncharacterized protein n=1 Tax=Peronospora belbahrii TaxID=622444 RepID=A0AAU9KP53_9STRA|nr:unnamed protein product [Peronospora belbahrii]
MKDTGYGLLIRSLDCIAERRAGTETTSNMLASFSMFTFAGSLRVAAMSCLDTMVNSIYRTGSRQAHGGRDRMLCHVDGCDHQQPIIGRCRAYGCRTSCEMKGVREVFSEQGCIALTVAKRSKVECVVLGWNKSTPAAVLDGVQYLSVVHDTFDCGKMCES